MSLVSSRKPGRHSRNLCAIFLHGNLGFFLCFFLRIPTIAVNHHEKPTIWKHIFGSLFPKREQANLKNLGQVIQSALFIPSWRPLNPLKGSLNHPKKVTLNHQGEDNFLGGPVFLWTKFTGTPGMTWTIWWHCGWSNAGDAIVTKKRQLQCSCTGPTSQTDSLRIQSPSQMMIGVYNHLLSKVFRFHYHSQKVIGSLGLLEKLVPSFGWLRFPKMIFGEVPHVFNGRLGLPGQRLGQGENLLVF